MIIIFHFILDILNIPTTSRRKGVASSNTIKTIVYYNKTAADTF